MTTLTLRLSQAPGKDISQCANRKRRFRAIAANEI